MTNRIRSTLMFSGRDLELAAIAARWRLACNVKNPCPQVVVIKAERGLGKTRLALEFYRWLVENKDGWLTKSYWPDALGIIDQSLAVNPDPNNCKFEVPIPYLWWGLRATDGGDAIGTYDRYLAPHLVALFLQADKASYVWSLALSLIHISEPTRH